jgi:hypothetical protein
MITRRIVLVTFCLLALAPSASADCRWALWAYQTNRVGFDLVLATERRVHPAGFALALDGTARDARVISAGATRPLVTPYRAGVATKCFRPRSSGKAACLAQTHPGESVREMC